MKITSKFWWFLRDFWHLPYFFSHSKLQLQGWPSHKNLPKSIRPSFQERLKYAYYIYSLGRGYLLSDIRHLVRFAYWKLRWFQPFRCDGRGGWRTRVCDFLENKARDNDIHS